MIKLDNGKYIIGFDNGYQFGKIANFMFDNGVVQQIKSSLNLQIKSGCFLKLKASYSD